MKKTPKILFIVLFIIVIFGILYATFKKTKFNTEISLDSTLNTNNINKIYTVKEVVELLKTNSVDLKNRSIQIDAFVVDGVRGVECSDYQIITDKEYIDTFRNMYNNKLSQEERNKAIEESRTAPFLLTGQTLIMPDGFFTTQHAIYQGHFYDAWATKTCGGDGYKRFVIDKKINEMTSSGNNLQINLDGYITTCTESNIVYKKTNNLWEKVLNNLPKKGLYYLDDKFVGYGMCDTFVCTELQKPYIIELTEYKKVGDKIPPSDSGSMANTLPTFKTVSLIGDIKIDINYFSDNNCQNNKTYSTIIKK